MAWLLAALALSPGCQDKKDGKASTAGPATPKRAIDPTTTGTLEGTIRFEGTAPPPRTIEMTLPECRAARPEAVELHEVAVKDGKLANSFVWVKHGLEDYAFETPTAEVVLDQKGCMYEPYVVGVQTGQKLVLVNSDSFNHNVNARPEHSPSFNVAMPTRGMRIERVLEEPEVMIKTKCDVHPWMLAWIGVAPHPHFKVTGEGGAFRFTGLPPRQYVVEAWHQVSGRQEQTVTLAAKGTQKVDFTFRAP